MDGYAPFYWTENAYRIGLNKARCENRTLEYVTNMQRIRETILGCATHWVTKN